MGKMTLMWSSSLTNQLIEITKKIALGLKMATAFIVHVSTEIIAKHSYSIELYIRFVGGRTYDKVAPKIK